MPSHAGSGDSLPFDQRHIFGNAGLHGICESHSDDHHCALSLGNKVANCCGFSVGHADRANASALADLNIHAAAYAIPFPDKYTVPTWRGAWRKSRTGAFMLCTQELGVL
jgi:hypothetical protein